MNGAQLDPIVDALLEHLPAPGDYFSKDDRKRWLQLIELAFDLIYDDEEPPHQAGADQPGPAMREHGSKA